MKHFIDVMYKVHQTNPLTSISRSIKRLPTEVSSRNKRLKMMNSSTPNNRKLYREQQIIPVETSPILEVQGELINASTSWDGSETRGRTNLSDELDKNRITPIKILTESNEERNLAGGARDLSLADKKSTSMPNLSWENIENNLFK